MLYYSVHFPTQFAFTQEIFGEDQYKTLNSMLEVQNQSTSMIAGGLASFIIDSVDLTWILLVDAITFFAGFGLFWLIPYIQSKSASMTRAGSIRSNIAEGFSYLKTKPSLMVFFLSALMPFVCVMIGNYLYPIYITSVLQSGASVLGMAEMIFAIGAVAAGFTVPKLMQRFGSYRTTVMTFAVFSLSITFFYSLPFVGIFLVFNLLYGWGNAGTRVARNTILMELVPNHLMGRVNSFFNTLGMGMRMLLIALCMQMVSLQSARMAILLLAALLLLSFIGLLHGRSLFTVNSQRKIPLAEKR